MNRTMYYVGMAIAGGGFSSLIYTEIVKHSAGPIIGGMVAATMVGGIILMGFSDEDKKAKKTSPSR